MEHQTELMWKQGCDCRLSKKQKTQYHFLQILCQAIRRANHQSYYWLPCTDEIFPQLSLKSNEWNYNEQLIMVLPVWFDGLQFPLSIIKKKINQRRRYQSMVMKQTLKILKDFTTNPKKPTRRRRN